MDPDINFQIRQVNMTRKYHNNRSQTNPRHQYGSFEHPKHMLKIMGKKIFTLKYFVYLNLWIVVSGIFKG